MNANENYLVQIEGWRGAVRQSADRPINAPAKPIAPALIRTCSIDTMFEIERRLVDSVPVRPAA